MFLCGCAVNQSQTWVCGRRVLQIKELPLSQPQLWMHRFCCLLSVLFYSCRHTQYLHVWKCTETHTHTLSLSFSLSLCPATYQKLIIDTKSDHSVCSGAGRDRSSVQTVNRKLLPPGVTWSHVALILLFTSTSDVILSLCPYCLLSFQQCSARVMIIRWFWWIFL